MPDCQISGIGWVLPLGHGTGAADFQSLSLETESAAAPGILEGFKAAPFLASVKGYLDPAGAYSLAAASLALGTNRRGISGEALELAGIAAVTNFGWTKSAFAFFSQFLDKGPRLASPLIFPHGYASTAGNLAAIEFGFGGPHMVFAGGELDAAMAFALGQVRSQAANDMLLIACEAAEPAALADDCRPLNGAVAVWLSARDGRFPALPLVFAEQPAVSPVWPAGLGCVAALIRTLQSGAG